MELHDDHFSHSTDFEISLLNSIVDPIAVLDENGIIRAVNDSRIRFALQKGGLAGAGEAVGQNYLNVCKNAARGRTDTEAYAALSGLRAVLQGDLREFHLDYACYSPTVQRWFQLRIVPFSDRGRGRRRDHFAYGDYSASPCRSGVAPKRGAAEVCPGSNF